MDQLIFASLSHTHYWYGVGTLKVPAVNAVGTQLRDPINSGLARWRIMAIMDAAAELGRNPVSKHQIQLECGDGQRLMMRNGTAEPVSRD